MKEAIKKETSAKEVSLVPSIAENKGLVNFDPQTQVEYAQKAANALMVVIDATKPLIMNNKRYLYFEHWQTVARFFNTTVGIAETTKDTNGYIAKAVVYDKNGVIIGGAEASCMKDEQNWKNKPDFQLRSMAQTRAMAKALRSIYGFVAVLAGAEATPAEEMSETIVNDTYPPSQKQLDLIASQMEEKNVTEADLIDEGYPPLKDLTGGQNGTASEVIGYLFKVSKFNTGLRPVSEQDKIVHQFTKNLEDCTTPEMYEKVKHEIYLARENGHLTENSYSMLVKTAKVIAQQIQDNLPTETKPQTTAAKLMKQGMAKAKAKL